MILQYPLKKYEEPFQSMATINGTISFNPIITQGFGANNVPFYAQLGLKGHNGIDYHAIDGTEIYAAHDGEITKTYDKTNSSPTIGYGIWITHSEGWQTVYFHLQDVLVKIGDKVKAGDLIGHADNTGQYTTGSHLHFGLYPANPDKNNGFGGTIDPTEYFNQPNTNTMIVDKELLKKLYLLGFKREPDPEAIFYEGKDISEVLDALVKSKENAYYTEVFKSVKRIEKEL